jgi:hypothetical protein
VGFEKQRLKFVRLKFVLIKNPHIKRFTANFNHNTSNIRKKKEKNMKKKEEDMKKKVKKKVAFFSHIFVDNKPSRL